MNATPYIQGFATGGTLIMAIGAQNAFVLTQGVRRQHHLPIALLCSACDALLITIGVLGVGTAVASIPWLGQLAAIGGAIFLLWYGLCSFRGMGNGQAMRTDEPPSQTLRAALFVTLGLTFLNPHVYLDTVVLLGGISGQYQGQGRMLFGIGAATASLVWFFSLALFGRLLAPLFRRPVTWKVLDGTVGLTMWIIAATLVHHAWATYTG